MQVCHAWITSTIDSPTWCDGPIPGSLAVDTDAVNGVAPFVPRARLFDNAYVQEQHLTVAAALGPRTVCCTRCVFGCGAQRDRADAAIVLLYPQVYFTVCHCG